MKDNSKILSLVVAINVAATGTVFLKPEYSDKLFTLYEVSIGGLYGLYQISK